MRYHGTVFGGKSMTTVTEIKEAVQALPKDEFEQFSSWFDTYEEEHRDQQKERRKCR